MESSFQLYVEVDVLLANMKERLMLHDEYSQVTCIERMINMFKCGCAVSGEVILSKLIKFDILSTLFEIMQTPADNLLPYVLELLSIVSSYRKFYDYHIAMEAVDSILKVSICVLKSRSKETQTLEKLISSIHYILHKAVEFRVDFDAVCVPRRLFHLLKSLILDTSFDQKIIFAAVGLLNIVLENVEQEEDWEDHVFEVCLKALESMREIVDYSDDDDAIMRATVALCAVCASGTRLCVMIGDSFGIFNAAAERRGTLTKSIYTATMNTIVPNAKDRELNETDRVRFHRNLVACLNNLYKLSSCSHDDLSNHLTANGYLKYFLLSTTRLPETLRRSTCMLLSRSIVILADKSMSISHWPEGPTAFENMIYRGLLDLPKDPQQWRNVITHHGSNATALMMLIYYHYHGTREHDMICLRSLIMRINNLPRGSRVPTQVLKAVWFLFAVASISHPSPNSEENYSKAVKRLASALRYSRLSDCYTYHIDLMHFCLKCGDIPKDLRNKALDLWLIESNGDIKPLLTLDCDSVVRHCLLLVIQTGYSERIINLAMKGIREMLYADNAKEIAEIAWHMLPSLLSPYEPSKDEQIKAVLELANLSMPESLPLNTKNRCADSLIGIILRRDSDLKLRTLAVMQSYVLLATTASMKPFTILEKHIRTPWFLEELQVQGFSEETPGLSAVCLKLLALIVRYQENSVVQRDRRLTIDAQSLADLLLNAQRTAHCSTNGMELTLELLTQNNIDGSAVGLDLIGSDIDVARGVINLYETLHFIHGKCDPMQRDLLYQCLQGVLKFCHEHAEALMYHLCGSMSNNDTVTGTLNTRYVSQHFLEFVSTWLRCRKRYCTDEGPWNDRSLCKTPFEETFDRILSYADSVKDARASDEAFNGLRYALSHFSEYIRNVRGC